MLYMPTYFIAPTLNATSVNWAATSVFQCLRSADPINDGEINDPDMFGKVLMLNSSGNLQFMDFYDFNISNLEYYTNFASFPATGELQVLYLDNATGEFYRWSGSVYVAVCGNYAPKASPTFTGTVALSQIAGRTSGTAVSAGMIGEVLSQSFSAGRAHVSSGASENVTTLVLTAGSWMVSGSITFVSSNSSMTIGQASLSTSSASIGGLERRLIQSVSEQYAGGALPPLLSNSSGSVTIYLVSATNYSSGTMTEYGTIYAVRIA